MANQPLLIQQVKLLDPVAATEQICDVLLEQGTIKAINSHQGDLPFDTLILPAQEKILGPGLVDLYSHTSEPGYEERETLSTLLAAATAGGFTRLTLLPDSYPALDNPAIIASLQQKTKKSTTHLNFWGALTVGAKGQQMNELAELSPAVVGFADSQSLENLCLLRRLLEYLKPLGKPVALFPCLTQLKGNGVMREGSASIRFGLPGNPAISESSAIALILELIALTETPVHFMRISTARSLELIAQAKSQGLPVTASTTWLHLLLDTEAIATYSTSLRLEPPLGNHSDMQALIAGVKQGTLDAIAVDHTPYTYEEKTLAFAEAPPGAIGLELILPLLWQRFVTTGELTPLQLWTKLSYGPQICLQQKPISVAVGEKAELTLFDPNLIWTANQDNLNSLSHNTSWLGKQITGRVVKIWN